MVSVIQAGWSNPFTLGVIGFHGEDKGRLPTFCTVKTVYNILETCNRVQKLLRFNTSFCLQIRNKVLIYMKFEEF